MNPAFSVIFFTTLSGTGFGLWFWLGLRIAFGSKPEWFDGLGWMFGLLAGAILVVSGVIASLWHLGKPARVWRAFSQWRSSWMSREGVFALAGFVVTAAIFALLWTSSYGTGLRILSALLACLAATAVYSTAMIYASLKPIPAWQHTLVVPAYLLFAALGGGILFALFAGNTFAPQNVVAVGILATAFGLWAIKYRYWQSLNRDVLPHTHGDAVGLPSRNVSTFERPHTENNYLSREMGFVLARKHSRQLRVIAAILFAVVPALCVLPVWFLPQADATPLIWLAAVSFQLGAFVERWLFFAEAKHLVTLYY